MDVLQGERIVRTKNVDEKELLFPEWSFSRSNPLSDKLKEVLIDEEEGMIDSDKGSSKNEDDRNSPPVPNNDKVKYVPFKPIRLIETDNEAEIYQPVECI